MKIELQEYSTYRTVFLTEDIDSTTAGEVKRAISDIISDDFEKYKNNIQVLATISEAAKQAYIKENVFPDITLQLDCSGGSVYDGLGLYDFIRDINNRGDHRIMIVCTGVVASMATIVLLASEHRVSTKNTSFLIHSLSDISFGKLQDVEDGLTECKRLNRIMTNIYLEHTKLTEKDIKEIDRLKKDWWFGADVALEKGLIKAIV